MEAPPSLFSTGLVSVSAVFPVLATGAVALRFIAHQTGSKRALYADDYVIGVTLLFLWAHGINIFVGAQKVGIDTIKLSALSDPDAVELNIKRALWVEGLMLAPVLSLVKITIALFYYRIFVVSRNSRLRIPIIIAITAVAAWGIETILCQIFIFDIPRAAWESVPEAKFNYDYHAWAVAYAALSIVFDVAILLLPVPSILRLEMDMKRKISILGIFWLGLFCCVAAGVRMYYLSLGSQSHNEHTSKTSNPWWATIEEFTWAHIEASMSVIAACLPTYGRLFARDRAPWRIARSILSVLTPSSRLQSDGSTAQSGAAPYHSNDDNSSSKQLHSKGSSEWYALREGSTYSQQQTMSSLNV